MISQGSSKEVKKQALIIEGLTEYLFKIIIITDSEENENKGRRINKADQFRITK